MDMTPQTAWLIAISAVVLVGVVAFFIGRSTAGTKARIDELEAELRGRTQEGEAYRKDVEAHFDKTATLFVSMAGSYKEMFEHLSSGYEQLSTGSARELFQQRVACGEEPNSRRGFDLDQMPTRERRLEKVLEIAFRNGAGFAPQGEQRIENLPA